MYPKKWGKVREVLGRKKRYLNIIPNSFATLFATCDISDFQFRLSCKITPKKICLLYTRTIMMLITNITLNFTIRTVLDLARFEDHTVAFFKGKC